MAEAPGKQVAIGCSDHTGWAVLVTVAGDSRQPAAPGALPHLRASPSRPPASPRAPRTTDQDACHHGAVEELPRTASEHPSTWKFDFPIFHPVDLAAWRAWLEHHHRSERGVWVVSWRKATGRAAVPYEDLVEEALCFGWIDSTAGKLDDERTLQLMTPRKPKSTWTRLNRRRVADLEAAGRMTDAGRTAVEVAQANGWWTILDPVEDLIEPADLAAALDATPAARTAWDGFPPSARKQMLFSVVSAVKPETRAARISRIVAEAAAGRRAAG